MPVDIAEWDSFLASYPHMQGLRTLPLGVVFVMSAAGRAGWLDWLLPSSAAESVLWFLLFLASLALARVITRYYVARFGLVTFRDRGVPPIVIVAAIFVLLLWLHRGPLQWIPIALQDVFIGVMLLYIGLAPPRLRKHYVAIGAVWLGFSSLEAFGVSTAARDIIGDCVVAGSLIIGGLADHFVLMRLLAPPRSQRISPRP